MGIDRQSKLPSYMWYTRTTLKLVGLWPSGNNGFIDVTYFFIIAVSMIVQAFQMLTNCWINYTNFESAAESIGPMMALVTSFGKMCIYRYQRSRLGRLAIPLENCLKNGPIDVLDNLEDYAKIGSIACGSLLFVSWLLTVLFLTAPLAVEENILPFASWYPFDYENSMVLYVLAYSHEAVLTCLGCCTMSTEITFVWSICHCCSRLRVMCDKLSSLTECDGENDSEETYSQRIQFKLSSLMKLHYEILSDVEEINQAYTYIMVILFFAAIIAICCACLQITSRNCSEIPIDRFFDCVPSFLEHVNRNIFDTEPFVRLLNESAEDPLGSSESFNWTICLFLILAMYYAEQLLFYYLPGEILAQQSMAVSFAAYSSGWEALDIKHQKTIRLLIMRSHLPPKLLVGQLSPLRLENYKTFLTTTGSYFTSIRAATDDSSGFL